MTQFKMMVTSSGKHPASKWAEHATDEIIEISDSAPETKVREAQDFRGKLLTMLTKHHQYMMDHEQQQIKAGKHQLDLPYKTEEYSAEVVGEILKLAKNYSFGDHFEQSHVQEHLEEICNRNFKSAKLVERSHFHSEKEGNKSKK